MTNNVLSNFIAPPVSVQITDGGATPIAGESYSLICTVSGAQNLNPTIIYQWTKTNGTVIQVTNNMNSNTLSFPTLRVSDSGDYVCKVSVSSDYLVQTTDASSNSFTVKFQGNFYSELSP